MVQAIYDDDDEMKILRRRSCHNNMTWISFYINMYGMNLTCVNLRLRTHLEFKIKSVHCTIKLPLYLLLLLDIIYYFKISFYLSMVFNTINVPNIYHN